MRDSRAAKRGENAGWMTWGSIFALAQMARRVPRKRAYAPRIVQRGPEGANASACRAGRERQEGDEGQVSKLRVARKHAH